MNETILRVEFASRDFDFACAEDPTNVANNLSKMTTLHDSIATRMHSGIAHDQQVTVFGRWVVVYKLVKDDSAKCRPTLLFFDLEIDMNLLKAACEGLEDLEREIIQTMEEYRKIFEPKEHDRVRLLSDPPG